MSGYKTQNIYTKAAQGDNGNPALMFLIVSLVFHGVVLSIVMGKIKILDKEDFKEEAVTVEIVNLEPEAQIKPKPIEEKAEEETAKALPKVEHKPEIVKSEPEKVEPEEQDEVPPLPTEKVEDDVTAEKVKEPEPVKRPPPVPMRRPKIKIEKPKKEETKKVEKPKPNFQSVLKNLAGSEDPVAKKIDKKEKSFEDVLKRQVPVLTQPPPVSEAMSNAESRALQRQLSSCWTIMPGARNAENLYVDVTLVMNPDRSIAQASITDTGRYNNDSFFRAAADNAMRALKHPSCKHLELPPYKYEQWKNMTVRFDPKNMY